MNYQLLENGIEIFGLRGYDLGRTWMVQFPDENGPIPVEVQPCSVWEDIVAIVREDERAGKAGRIEHILVSANSGLILFLEGALTARQFEQAHQEEGLIEIWVEVEKKRYPLWITDAERNPRNISTATIDVFGNIV